MVHMLVNLYANLIRCAESETQVGGRLVGFGMTREVHHLEELVLNVSDDSPAIRWLFCNLEILNKREAAGTISHFRERFLLGSSIGTGDTASRGLVISCMDKKRHLPRAVRLVQLGDKFSPTSDYRGFMSEMAAIKHVRYHSSCSTILMPLIG
jgi:hypothetical protein